jgi:hypothetical protein
MRSTTLKFHRVLCALSTVLHLPTFIQLAISKNVSTGQLIDEDFQTNSQKLKLLNTHANVKFFLGG